MDTFIVVPVFNESRVLGAVVAEIQAAGFMNIILVDDGSSDTTWEKMKALPVIGVHHRINRGKGAATKTGIEAARRLKAAIVVTMDGDGQHNPADIPGLIAPLLAGTADVALGTRLLQPQGMPWYRRLANKTGNVFTWLIHGLLVTDSQSGFRAYNRRAIEQINTVTDRYEYDSEVIAQINRFKLRFVEVPITVRYTPYSLHKGHGQSLRTGLVTLGRMLWGIVS